MAEKQFDPHQIGLEAYYYLYPLVTMEITRRTATNAPSGSAPGRGPMNTFSHIRSFPDADFRIVVRPNFDTLYSSAWLDLSDGPVVVSAPDTGGRYYLLPMLGMWTDVFASPGWRTSGTGPAHWAVVPPGWTGDLPDGVRGIDAPTPTVWVIGRTQTNGPADYDAVHAVQDGFTVTPLADWGGPVTTPEAVVDPDVDMETEPLRQVNAMSALDFLALGSELLTTHGPHVTDWSLLERIRRIGVVPGQVFEPSGLGSDVTEALEGVPAEAQQYLQGMLARTGTAVNGWMVNTEGMGVYGDYYVKRAMVAMMGLGANTPEDAIYPIQVNDAEGRPTDGSHDYALRFAASELPPVDAFWSLTMYDGEGFQIANAIDRFALGDRDALTYGPDGSLRILVQRDSPGDEHEGNWLPAPAGPFSLCLRLYAPRPDALDGRWSPPPLRRA